jgi:two-component sensor histidine kinase
LLINQISTYSSVLKFKNFLVSFLLVCLIFPAINGQVLIDVKSRGIEDGLKDRLVTNICRDKFGFFYLTSEASMQKYDGENFTDIDANVMIAAKINPSDILAMKSVKGDVYFSTDPSPFLFFIKAGSNKIESIKLTKSYKAFFVEDDIYLANQIGDNYEVGLYQTEYNRIKPIFASKTKPSEIVLNNNELYYQDESSIYILKNNKPILFKNFKGRIISSKDKLYLANDKILQAIDKSGNIATLYNVKNPVSILKIFKKDKLGNLLLAYTHDSDYTNNITTVINDRAIELDSLIIPIDNKFIDVHSEDFSNKIMTVGHQGIYVFTLMQEGAWQIFNKKLVKTFGNIVTSIAGNGTDEVIFLSEEKGIYQIQDNLAVEIFTGNNLFYGNGKMVYNKSNDRYYNYSSQYLDPNSINEIDLKNKKVKGININLQTLDLTVNGDLLYVTGRNFSTKKGEILTLNLTNIDAKPIKVFQHPNLINGVFFHQDKVWISTPKGILITDKNFKILKTLDRYQTDKNFYIQHDMIRDLKMYNGKIIAGSLGGGIYIIDPQSYKVVGSLDQKSGLTDNKAIGILEDNQGNCWIPTWNGLNAINKDFKIIKTIYQYQGLPDKEMNTKAYYKDNAGMLYFGSVNGIFKIDPTKVLDWKYSHGIYLKNAISITKDKIEYLKKPIFYNDIKSLTLEFSAPDYFIYKYDIPKIEISGLKKNKWQIEKLTAHIVNPSTEEGKIKVSSSDSNFHYEADFKIQPNYNQYFKILGLLALLSLIVYLIIQKIKKNEEEKTRTNKKIVGLELSALQSQMNPHFIFNSLGAIQYFIQTHDAEKADDYLSNFAKLMRMILESSKSRYITISDEIELLKLYLGLEQIRFEDKFTYELISDDDLDLDFKIPPMIVQPYIENAINHGIVNLKDKIGKLTVTVNNLDTDAIEMIITDNGIGRAEAIKLRNKNHKSRGMQIVNERIQTFNESDNFKVNSKIDDLYDDKGNASGTKITLTFLDKQ